MNCLHMDHLVLATHHTEYCTCSGICSIPCPRKSALLKIEFFTAYRACSHISLLACSLRCILDHVVHDNSRGQNFLDQCHSHPSRTDCLYQGPWMLLHLVLVRYNTLCGDLLNLCLSIEHPVLDVWHPLHPQRAIAQNGEGGETSCCERGSVPTIVVENEGGSHRTQLGRRGGVRGWIGKAGKNAEHDRKGRGGQGAATNRGGSRCNHEG